MGDTVIVETPVDEVVSIVTAGPQGPSGSEAATLTTTGDLLYRAALANDRLPIGSEGQVLKVASGLPAWGNESGAVTSVNGETGAVTLAAADVGAATSAQGALADTAVQPGDLATVATSGDYDDLTNKPSTFTPSAHTHPISDVTNLQTALDGKSALGHTHIASDIVFGQFNNDRIDWNSPNPIGSSNPQAGTFTTLTANTALVLRDITGNETATFDAQGKLSANRTYDLPDASGTIALNPMTAQGDLIVGGSSGTPARLGIGTNGQQLRVSSGGSLEYFTPSAGGTKTYAVFTATDNQPPSTAFATLDTRGTGVACLDFDDATDESAVFVGIIPEGASLGSGLKIRLHWAATTATSGDVRWDVSLERMTSDLDSDSFDTVASATATTNTTAAGILTVTEITLTTIDSVTAGDGFRLKVTRDANNAADTMSGGCELYICEVRSAA